MKSGCRTEHTLPNPRALSLFGTAFTTPVTLSSFLAEPLTRGVRFQRTTATEVGNVGFLLFEHTGRRWRQINPELLPSNASDSLGPQKYGYVADDVSGSLFRLVDVDLRGNRTYHGPFELGTAYGQAQRKRKKIDWQAIRSEHQSKKAQRMIRRQRAVQRNLERHNNLESGQER